jgi:hypothetical protein
MKLQQNLTERIARELVKLEATEFLGVCTIINVQPIDEDGHPKEFEVLWDEVVDKIDSMSRLRKRNLERLVRAAIKGRNK